MHKCQRCQNPATLHITEILTSEKWEEVHLCEGCANKYLQENSSKNGGKEDKTSVSDEAVLGQQECPHCGVKFVDFRNSGRLGCPQDYDVFREELVALLENIHGEVKHTGKVPRRYPESKRTQGELAKLRNQLKQAVTREDYEAAATLRDQIRQLEGE